MQGNHFSGIFEILEMSGNLAEVSVKSGIRPKVGEKSGYLCSQGKLIVAALAWTVMFMDTFLGHHVTYLYFIRTVIHFLYMFLSENLDL